MGKRKTSRHSIVCTLIDHKCRPISGREIPQLSLEIVKRAYENKTGRIFASLAQGGAEGFLRILRSLNSWED